MRALARKLDADLEERNYAKQPLTKSELAQILDAVGDVATLLNKRHAVAKARGWADKLPSKSAFISAAVDEPNLLRRPIVVRGKRAVVGTDEAAVRALLS